MRTPDLSLRPGLGTVEWSLESTRTGELVLTLTENASAVVREIAERMPESEAAGLRLSSAPEGSAPQA